MNDIINALRTLSDCSRAIVGADPQDEQASEAFDMYFAAQKAARAALSRGTKPVAWAAFRDGVLLPKSVTTDREELFFEANGDWVGCELRPLVILEAPKE